MLLAKSAMPVSRPQNYAKPQPWSLLSDVRSHEKLDKGCASDFSSIRPMIDMSEGKSQRQSAADRFLNDAVAVTSRRFQAFAIENRDTSAPVIRDQTFLF